MQNESMQSSNQKGRSLEKAVSFIQQTILRSNPQLQGTQFTVEANKIIDISGVRHEVDVFVRTLVGSEYESSWVFECKNQKDPVGKNEIIILSEKVNAISATRGFLVAHRITKDAEAQIKLNKRLSFVRCSDDFLSPLNSLQLRHASVEALPAKVLLKERGVAVKMQPRNLEWTNKRCRSKGEQVDLPAFVISNVDRIVAEDQKENASQYKHEGTHWREQAVRIEFEPSELLIGDLDVEYMMISVRFSVTVRTRKLISRFELDKQGRVFTFEPIDDLLPGKRIEIDVVQRL